MKMKIADLKEQDEEKVNGETKDICLLKHELWLRNSNGEI